MTSPVYLHGKGAGAHTLATLDSSSKAHADKKLPIEHIIDGIKHSLSALCIKFAMRRRI